MRRDTSFQFLDGREEMYAIGTDLNETNDLLAGTVIPQNFERLILRLRESLA